MEAPAGWQGREVEALAFGIVLLRVEVGIEMLVQEVVKE